MRMDTSFLCHLATLLIKAGQEAGLNVRYFVLSTGLKGVPTARIEAKVFAVPTTCKMERP